MSGVGELLSRRDFTAAIRNIRTAFDNSIAWAKWAAIDQPQPEGAAAGHWAELPPWVKWAGVGSERAIGCGNWNRYCLNRITRNALTNRNRRRRAGKSRGRPLHIVAVADNCPGPVRSAKTAANIHCRRDTARL